MGGVAKIFTKVLTKSGLVKAPKPVAPQQQIAQVTQQKAQKSAALGGGKSSYGGTTIMGSASGDETEANVSSTVLGGTATKGKKKKETASTGYSKPSASA
tara:strand:+ start:1938 stop:2237 length:300 start_codon:yes stop_codon:yes gene_type:complete